MMRLATDAVGVNTIIFDPINWQNFSRGPLRRVLKSIMNNAAMLLR